MKLPVVISAYKGTYDEKALGTGTKYKYSVLNFKEGTKPSLYIDSVTSAITHSDIVIVPARADIQQEMYKKDISFYCVYPKDNCCGPWQDRLDEMGFSEEEVCNMIANWKTDVKDHTYRQMAIKVVTLDENEYLTDDLITSW